MKSIISWRTRRLLLILPLAAILSIGCSRGSTPGPPGPPGQKLIPPGKDVHAVARQDEKGLQGTWKIVSMFMGRSGKNVPAERIADIRVRISGQQYTLTKGGKVIERATMVADPAKQPKVIDLAFTQGESKGQTLLCIYDVTGDTLRIAWSEPGKARASDFANRPGLRQDVWELRRE